MSPHLRRLRGLAVALAVLSISAGVVLAGGPRIGPPEAPVAPHEPAPTEVTAPTEVPAATQEPAPTDAPEDTEAGGTADQADDERGAAHGAMVAAAARMDTPEGFRNHGAFVSCVARMREIADPGTVTVAMCAEAAAARNAAKAARATQRDAANGERAAAKAERAAAKAERKAGERPGRP